MNKDWDDRQARALVDASGVATALLDASARLAYANPAFVELAGCAPARVAGAKLTTFLDARTVAAIIASKSSLRTEARLRNTRGWDGWVQVVVAPLPDAAGMLILQLIDIGHHKRVEAALKLSESRFNGALAAANQGVWDHDVPTDTMFYSDGWRQMRGIPLGEEVDGAIHVWLARVHPDDRERVRIEVTEQNAAGMEFHVLEYREQRRDGRYIWIQSRGRTIAWDENGNATRTIGTDTDITALKTAQQQTQELSRRLELALDASAIGVWEHDLRTDLITWDERMYEIYGRTDARYRDWKIDWFATVHPDDLEAAEADFERAIRDQTAYFSQFRIVWPDGTVRHLRSRGIFVDDGTPRLIGAEWDMTADVQLHEEVQEARALAEARLNELQDAQAHIQHAALHDYLTDLPNRRFLDKVLNERRRIADGRSQKLALLHVDLDGFKQINDRHGHAAGDGVLRHVAQVLRDNVRETDFVARVGGDEFIVVCWFDGKLADLSTMAERILRPLHLPFRHEGLILQVGASMGIAYDVFTAEHPTQLLHDADIALYRAKDAGRNRYEIFQPAKAS